MNAYKIGELPGSKAYIEEIADFWELEAIRREGDVISMRDILVAVSVGVDEELQSGIEADDDAISERLQDAWCELERRVSACAGCYPFSIDENGIRFTANWGDRQSTYIFMLLATRLNMKTRKVFAMIDGTKLFEELCATVATAYFGANAQSLVFGTAVAGGFTTKVADLVTKLGEGGGFKNPNPSHVTKNDDGIDVVVWRNFADKRRGKLIGFGQCKTGTEWRDEIHKLKPRDFCDNWFVESPLHAPIAMIFLCDTLNWYLSFHSDLRGYLVFNRFRIAEYTPVILGASISTQLKLWIDEALAFVKNS